MRLKFLGTRGGFWGDNESFSSAILYDEDDLILIDAGSKKTLKEIPSISSLENIILTHKHIDHTCHLGKIVKEIKKNSKENKINQKLNIYGPPSKYVNWIKRKNKKYLDFNVTEQIPNKIKQVKIDYIETIHHSKNFCYKFTKEKEIICYTGDCTYTKDLVSFCKDSDILVTEATYNNRLNALAKAWGHMTPEFVAKLANKAKPKLLVLTHFNIIPAEEFLREVKKLYAGDVIAACEGMEIDIKGDYIITS